MRVEKETRPSRQANGRGLKDNHIVAQKNVDQVGLGSGIAMVLLMLYITLCETGVLA